MSKSFKLWRFIAIAATAVAAVSIAALSIVLLNQRTETAPEPVEDSEPIEQPALGGAPAGEDFFAEEFNDAHYQYTTPSGELLKSTDGENFYDESGNIVEALDLDPDGNFIVVDEADAAQIVSYEQVLSASASDLLASNFLGRFQIEAAAEGYRGQGELLFRDPQTIIRATFIEDFDFGDVDGDGDLDVIIGRRYQPNQLFANENGVFSLVWTAESSSATTAVEWGDVDGDGDLDLAVANRNTFNELYLNENGTLQSAPSWHSFERGDPTNDLQWGDMNGDGWLDLVVANGKGAPDRIYLNNGDGMLAEMASWSGDDASANQETLIVDLGQFNMDNRLDMALAVKLNEEDAQVLRAAGQPIQNVFIRENDLENNRMPMGWSTAVTNVVGLAWGDVKVDSNELPDLAVVDASARGQDGVLSNSGDGNLDGQGWRPQIDGLALDASWGDVNGDGFLDLAIALGANGHERVYLNNNGNLSPIPDWTSDGYGNARKLAWADIDSDRDLDLVVWYQDQLSVYTNRQAPFRANAAYEDTFQDMDNSFAIDLADFNQDGFLDMAVGNSGPFSQGAANYLYLNQGGQMFAQTPVPLGTAISQTYGVAWGDVNNDGLLDLAIANGGLRKAHNLIYFGERQNGTIQLSSIPLMLPESENSRDLAWGDVDGDGDLDLVVANRLQPNRLYIYDQDSASFSETVQFGFNGPRKGFASNRLDFGDMDGDGDLDLAVSNFRQPNRIYYNNNGRFSDEAVISFGTTEGTQGLDWGDFDGDGRLDIAVANKNGPNQLYWNAGGYIFPVPVWESDDIDDSFHLAWGDADGDGDLDLAVANRGGEEEFAAIPNKLYINNNGILQTARDETLWNTIEQQASLDVDWGDIDNDGDLDLVFGNGVTTRNNQVTPDPVANQIYLNELVPISADRPGAAPAAIAIRSLATAGHRLPLLDTQTRIIENGRLDITYELTHPQGLPYPSVRGFYSLDGGNTFQVAAPISGTVVTNLPLGQPLTYSWDIFQSGFFGASDNVVFRLEAYEVLAAGEPSEKGVFAYSNGVGLDAQRPFVAVNTFPLRVRGNQVRVMFSCTDGEQRPCPADMNVGEERPLEDAVVYNLPASQAAGADWLTSDAGQVFATNSSGYLQGRTNLNSGDHLISLWPVPTDSLKISLTNRMRLFYMSASPTITGVKSSPIETLTGIQTIEVSNEHPLMLIDLIVSIEWDASQDTAFMAELETAFLRASEILFDVSNGQAAIGNVFVFHARQYWNMADIVILANNDLRPSAAIGGVVTAPVDERLVDGEIIEDVYLPGQIRMGPSWDPFGQSAAELSEEWYRALAHELAHYAFFLPDNYLGIESGILRRINCQGSFMTTTRDPSYSEFLTQIEWETSEDCQNSLAEQTTGRNDWETITSYYPFMKEPVGRSAETVLTEDGPQILPLNVTQFISFRLDHGDRRQLPARIIEIRNRQNERIRVPNAQVYLIQTQATLTDGVGLTDDVLIYLGSPIAGGDRIQLRGAFAGDQLCVFDNSHQPPLHHCEPLDETDVSIQLFEQSDVDWQPIIEVTTAASRTQTLSQTVLITVTQAVSEDQRLHVQVYPAHYHSLPGNFGIAPTAVLSREGDVHQAAVSLPLPAYDIFVRVWLEGNESRQSIAQFTVKPTWQSSDYMISPHITIPLNADLALVLIGDPNGIPIGGPNGIPIGGPNGIPIGGPNGIPIGGPNGIPIGGPNGIPIGGPNGIPIGGPNGIPIGGPNGIPIGGPNGIPIGGPNGIPIGGPNGIPIGGPNGIPIGGPNGIPIGGPNGIPIGGPNGIPIGGGDNQSAYAPIVSSDAQLIIYNNDGFFEDNGVERLQVVTNFAPLPSWLVPVGQAYSIQFSAAVSSPRSVAFTYLQRDVPAGFEEDMAIAFLPLNETEWQLIPSRQFIENLIVAQLPGTTDSSQLDGTYLVVSTIALPPLQNGWNLVGYTVPVSRPVEVGLGSILPHLLAIADAEGSLAPPEITIVAETAVLTPKVPVNVRESPTIQNSPVSYLSAGEMVQILQYSPGNEWQQIDCPARLFRPSPLCWVTGKPIYVDISGVSGAKLDSDLMLEFGHVYWVFIDGLEEGEQIVPYLAPPTVGLDGTLK